MADLFSRARYGVVVALVAVLALGGGILVAHADNPVTYYGCLSKGILYNVTPTQPTKFDNSYCAINLSTRLTVNGTTVTWSQMGPQGAQGIQGPKGDTGAQGPQGPQGDIGPKGDTGAQGLAGADGAVGSQGPAGQQGLPGDPGPAGPAGSQGPQGDVGPAGPAGPAGPQGPQGDAGPAGPQGPQGVQGLPGGISGLETVYVSGNAASNAGSLSNAEAKCPTGKALVSGGFGIYGVGRLIASAPSNVYNATSWYVSVENDAPTGSGNTVKATAYAICAYPAQ